MTNEKRTITAVVINWNRKDLTFACLKSLEPVVKRNKNFSIILVDNASKDDSVKSFKNLNKKNNLFTLIVNKQNKGWAGGHNVGITHALKKGADAIFVLANDATVENNTISKLSDVLFSDKNIGIVGPKIYFPNSKKIIIANAGGMIRKHRYFGYDQGMGEKDRGQYDDITSPDFITGAGMLIKKEVFKKVGFFDDVLFVYYEDTDFCYRTKKAHFTLRLVPDAILYHEGGATTVFGSPLHAYYTTRNHLLFVERHAPLSVKFREFLRTPKTILELIRSKEKNKKFLLLGIRDYYLRRFGQQTYW